MDRADQTNNEAGTNAAKGGRPAPEPPTNKFAIARLASKQRKKRAHRRSLRRSNTKG